MTASDVHIDGPRACGPYELTPTVDFNNRVMRIGQGILDPTIATDYPHLFCEDNRENMRIIKVDGKVVSHAAMFLTECKVRNSTLRLAGFGCMATHPDYRHRGYGSMVVTDFFARMKELEADLAWLGPTDLDDWYRGLDWDRAGRAHVFTLDRGNIELLPELGELEVLRGHVGRVGQMTELHQQHPTGTNRSESLFTVLLDRPSTGRWPQIHTYLAAESGRIVAYVILSGAELIEHAGPPMIVAGLIRELFTHQDNRSISTTDRNEKGDPLLQASVRVWAPAIEDDISGFFCGLGAPCESRYLGMLAIPDASRIFDRIGISDVRVTQEADRVTLARGGERATLPSKHLPKLLFGPERIANFALDLLPIPLYHWPLDYI